MSVLLESEVNNCFPDCVAMKLHVQASSGTTKSPLLPIPFKTQGVAHLKEVDVSLTINFSGEQKIKIPGGTRLKLPGGMVTFGVRRGELRFSLQNCKLPLEKIILLKPFKVSIEIERQRTSSRGVEASAALATRSVGAKASEEAAEKTTVEIFQVKYIGSETDPGWVFESYDKRVVLEGMLTEKLLGVLEVADFPCEMTADFTVRGEDVRITWGQIGQVEAIHRNKLAVIERAIALQHIKPMIESAPICQGTWKHD